MQYVHRWDLGDRGKLYLVTEETMPKGTVSLSNGYEGKIKTNAKKIIKMLDAAPVTKEIIEEEKIEVAPKTATVANILRNFAQGLEEK
jgi:hypothetical protein